MESKVEIIFIDDNTVDCFINEKVVKRAGVEIPVRSFLSGKEALAFLNKPSKINRIIFLDIQMPVMNGFDVLDEYSALDKSVTDGNSIFMLSSSSSSVDTIRAKKYPVLKGFFSKPFEESMLREAIEKSGLSVKS